MNKEEGEELNVSQSNKKGKQSIQNYVLVKKKVKKLSPIKDQRTILDKLQETNIKSIQDQRNEKSKQFFKKIDIFDFSETSDLIKDFLFADVKKNTSIYECNQVDFGETKYVGDDEVFNFYNKFHKTVEYQRKGRLSKLTPSFNFIIGTKANNIVPNPVGIVKRKGKLASIELNKLSLGNNYLNCISASLNITKHLEEIKLSNNRLDDEAVANMISVLISNKSMKSKITTIDISFNYISNKTIDKLMEYIKLKGCILSNINLEGNLLGDKLLNPFLDIIDNFLADKLVYLNLAKNNITNNLMGVISDLAFNCAYLKYLNLHENQIKNQGAALLISKIIKHTDIKVLDLGSNLIGDFFQIQPTKEELIQQHYSKQVEKEKQISKLIKSDAVQSEKEKKAGSSGKQNQEDPLKKIYPLYNNAELEELRIMMGEKILKIDRTKVSNFCVELGNFFKENTSLIHLDISHNNISYIDCCHLAKEVVSNHNILGIHVEGNEMIIDDLGFIIPLSIENSKSDYYANYQISFDINSSLLCFNNKPGLFDKVRQIRAKNNCWICEAWKEVKFIYKPKNSKILNDSKSGGNTILNSKIEAINKTRQLTVSSNLEDGYKNQTNHSGNNMYIMDGNTKGSDFNGTKTNADVKVHISQDSYKNFDANKNIDHYYCYRMCKPGVLLYFYSVNGEPVTNYGSSTISLNEGIIMTYEKEKEFNDDETERKQYIVSQVGEMLIEPFDKLIDSDYNSKIKFCVPRPEAKVKTKVRPKTPWVYSDSIWAYYGFEYDGFSESSTNDAFEFDYERSKIKYDKDLNPTEEPLLKDYLKFNYSNFVDTYKYLSCSSGQQVFCVTQNGLLEFSNICQGLCDKPYNFDFLLLKAAEVKNLDKEERKNKNKLVPDNIIRHQFMAFLVKIAKDKYMYKTNKFNSVFEATKYSFDEHYSFCFSNQNHHKWRLERYYNEHVDNFFKAYFPVFDSLYRSFSKREIGKKEYIFILVIG